MKSPSRHGPINWSAKSCAVLAAVVIMLSPLETGTTRGRRRERGRSRETGPSRGYLAPAGGVRRSAKTRRLASRGGAAGHGPSISYMEGPCLILPGRNVLPGRHPGGRRNAAMIGGPAGHGRGSRTVRAGPAPGPCGTRRSSSPHDWVPRRRVQGRLRGPAPRHRPLPGR